MKRMTHGELRGLLMLLALMMLVVVYAWVFKGGDANQSAGVPKAAVVANADSLITDEKARKAEEYDSLRRAHRDSTATQSREKRGEKSKSGESSKSTKKGKPRKQVDRPSPKDQRL